jgi:hypothetical protein
MLILLPDLGLFDSGLIASILQLLAILFPVILLLPLLPLLPLHDRRFFSYLALSLLNSPLVELDRSSTRLASSFPSS